MMYVTDKTFGMLVNGRSKKNVVMVQGMNKNGKWGKAFEARVFGAETPEQVVARLTKLNDRQFRLAE